MPDEPLSPLRAFVDRLHRHTPLRDEEAGALLSINGLVSTARANFDIVSPGANATHTTLVLDGLAGRFEQVVSGQRQITALHVAGDMCDLYSVVTPRAGWGLQALSETSILRVPHSQLIAVARQFSNVAEAFWRDCSIDASVLSKWVANVGRRDSRSRLAHLLCEMGVRLEGAGLGDRNKFALKATQAQLGDALGLTPVHVNRTVRGLRELGLIEVRAYEVIVFDWARLAKIGDFEEQYLQRVLSD